MTSPIHAIRDILGMRPDHATEAIDHLEVAESVTSDVVRNEHLTKALIHSNLALVEALTRNRNAGAPIYNINPPSVTHATSTPDRSVWRTSNPAGDWAGMEGNE